DPDREDFALKDNHVKETAALSFGLSDSLLASSLTSLYVKRGPLSSTSFHVHVASILAFPQGAWLSHVIASASKKPPQARSSPARLKVLEMVARPVIRV